MAMGLLQIGQGVDGRAVDPHLEVTVGAGGAACAARLGDLLSLVNLLTGGNQQRGVMGIVGLGAVVVGDDDQLAVGSLPAGEGDSTAVSGIDGSAVGGTDVDAGVVAVAAEDIAAAEVRGDAAVDGPGVSAGRGGLGTGLGADGLDGGGGLTEGLLISRWLSLPLT